MALTPTGVRPAEVFLLSLWTGWALTLGAAELWIRYTRSHGRPPALPERPAWEDQEAGRAVGHCGRNQM